MIPLLRYALALQLVVPERVLLQYAFSSVLLFFILVITVASCALRSRLAIRSGKLLLFHFTYLDCTSIAFVYYVLSIIVAYFIFIILLVRVEISSQIFVFYIHAFYLSQQLRRFVLTHGRLAYL